MTTEIISRDNDLSPAMESSYEMKPMSGPKDSQPTSPAALSVQSSMAALHVADSTDDGVNVQELPPVDRGVKAWTFCAAGFVLEMMIWGFGFRFGVLHALIFPSGKECTDESVL